MGGLAPFQKAVDNAAQGNVDFAKLVYVNAMRELNSQREDARREAAAKSVLEFRDKLDKESDERKRNQVIQDSLATSIAAARAYDQNFNVKPGETPQETIARSALLVKDKEFEKEIARKDSAADKETQRGVKMEQEKQAQSIITNARQYGFTPDDKLSTEKNVQNAIKHMGDIDKNDLSSLVARANAYANSAGGGISNDEWKGIYRIAAANSGVAYDPSRGGLKPMFSKEDIDAGRDVAFNDEVQMRAGALLQFRLAGIRNDENAAILYRDISKKLESPYLRGRLNEVFTTTGKGGTVQAGPQGNDPLATALVALPNPSDATPTDPQAVAAPPVQPPGAPGGAPGAPAVQPPGAPGGAPRPAQGGPINKDFEAMALSLGQNPANMDVAEKMKAVMSSQQQSAYGSGVRDAIAEIIGIPDINGPHDTPGGEGVTPWTPAQGLRNMARDTIGRLNPNRATSRGDVLRGLLNDPQKGPAFQQAIVSLQQNPDYVNYIVRKGLAAATATPVGTRGWKDPRRAGGPDALDLIAIQPAPMPDPTAYWEQSTQSAPPAAVIAPAASPAASYPASQALQDVRYGIDAAAIAPPAAVIAPAASPAASYPASQAQLLGSAVIAGPAIAGIQDLLNPPRRSLPQESFAPPTMSAPRVPAAFQFPTNQLPPVLRMPPIPTPAKPPGAPRNALSYWSAVRLAGKGLSEDEIDWLDNNLSSTGLDPSAIERASEPELGQLADRVRGLIGYQSFQNAQKTIGLQ